MSKPDAPRCIDPTTGAGIYTHEVVATLLDPPNGLPVLDLGAGIGNFTAFLDGAGYRVTAVDIDKDDYERAGLSSAPFLASNLDEGLPSMEGPIGGVVAIEIIEHLENPLRLVREVAEVLVDGGWFIVTTPNISSVGSQLERMVRGHDSGFDDYSYSANGHISPVSLTQLERMGARVGLVVETATYNVGKLPIPKLRQRYPLSSGWARSSRFGDSLIVKFRRSGDVPASFVRG